MNTRIKKTIINGAQRTRAQTPSERASLVQTVLLIAAGQLAARWTDLASHDHHHHCLQRQAQLRCVSQARGRQQ